MLHRSPVLLTPFSQDRVIESEPLSDLLESSFLEGGLSREGVDTGAVILTGEAARRKNARKIAELFSDVAGRFVCATAGPRLEAILAAHGSGTVGRSREWGADLLNVDVGGGTTKVTLVHSGRIAGVMVLNLGARLIACNGENRVHRIEEGGTRFMEAIGRKLSMGDRMSENFCEVLTQAMADALFQVLLGEKPPWEGLMVTEPINQPLRVDGVVFSGGVAEYIYGRESSSFGDVGPQLGHEIKKAAVANGFDILDSAEGLRATVIGASQYTIQMSGETIHLPVPSDLPFRNLRVVPVSLSWQPPIAERSRKTTLKVLRSLDPEVQGDPFALAIDCPEFIGYSSVQELAAGLCTALTSLEPDLLPKALIFNRNIGRVVGGVLGAALPIPCIDEIVLSELDFIDIGAPIPGQEYLPIVVKSLAFGV